MSNLRHLVREHVGALALAFLLALLCAFPQVAFRLDHAKDGVYQGIELLPDNSWPPRVREVMDGNSFGDIYFKENKTDPYIFQPLNSMTVAYMGKAFNLDINDTLLLSRVVLPFLAFLFIYAFVYAFWRDRAVALAGASLLLLANSVMTPTGIRILLHGMAPSTNFLDIGLPVNPVMIYLGTFAFLTTFWLFYRTKDWRWGALSALFLGVNFYNYFYSWTYLYAFGGILFLACLALGWWRDALRVALVYGGALVIAIPCFINLYRASQYPTYVAVGHRLGLIETHAPAFIGVVALGALIVYGVGFYRTERHRYVFGLALLLAPILTLNQQVVTGKEMQPAHYHWYFHRPLAVILVLITLFYLMSRTSLARYKNAIALALVAGCFLLGAFIQINSYFYGRDGGTVAIARQRYGPVMAWLNERGTQGDVVLATDETSYMVSIYTPYDLFYHRAGYATLAATDERLRDIVFTFYRLRGIPASTTHDTFYTDAERNFIGTTIYGIYYRQLNGSYGGMPDATLDAIVEAYQATWKTPTPAWLAATFKKYDVHWVVWDTVADPSWKLDQYPFLKKEATFGDLLIYHVEQ